MEKIAAEPHTAFGQGSPRWSRGKCTRDRGGESELEQSEGDMGLYDLATEGGCRLMVVWRYVWKSVLHSKAKQWQCPASSILPGYQHYHLALAYLFSASVNKLSKPKAKVLLIV